VLRLTTQMHYIHILSQHPRLYLTHHFHSPPSPPSFFFNDTAPTEIYTLSLHDALPIFLDLRDPRLTPTEKFVMLDYAEHANSDTRRAWPSASTVAAETGMGQSTVERSLTRLRKFGYLVKVGKHRVGEHAWVWVYEVQTEVEV